jgi:hypothetical protein
MAMRFAKAAVAALSLVLAATACASIETVTTAEQFRRNADDVREQMRDGGRYEGMSRDEREQVERELGRMQALFDEYGSTETMVPDKKMDLFNAQERANAILTQNDGDRLVCRMERRTGSKMSERVCRKVSDIERIRNRHRDEYEAGAQTQRWNRWQGSGGG